MKTIYKYELSHFTTLRLPESAKFLSVANQKNKVVCWFEIDNWYQSEDDTVKRHFVLVETGKDFKSVITDNGYYGEEYLGTVLLDGGDYVVHVYECKELC